MEYQYTFDPCKAERIVHYVKDSKTGEDRPVGLDSKDEYQIMAILADWWGQIFRYNEFDDKIYAVNPPFPMDAERGSARLSETDEMGLLIWLQCTQDAKPARGAKLASIAAARARANRYHPIRDWLRSIPPATTKHLDSLASTLFGDDRPIAQEYVRKQLIASCARIMQPGCRAQSVLTLVGPSGAERKSTAIRELYKVPGCETFRDDLPDIRNAQLVGMAFDGTWCVELSELVAMRKADVETFKAFVTRREEKYSPKYVKGEVTRPRQCVLWASTNTAEFLPKFDPAFRRRFWAVHMRKRVNLEWLEGHRSEIWAEAFAAYQAGEAWWFEDESKADEGRQGFVAESSIGELLQPYLKANRNFPEGQNSSMIAKTILGCNAPTNAQAGEVTSCLEELGYERDTQSKLWKPRGEAKAAPETATAKTAPKVTALFGRRGADSR